ncbi:hypothetical protein OQA88_7969 [Cercophora sp. LCS_1]
MATLYAPPPTSAPLAHGGGDPFAHIRQYPMFPLLSPEDEAAVAKMRQDAATLAGFVQPAPQLSVAEKAVMHASGMEVMNVRKFENAAFKTTSALTNANASAVHTAMLTRWGAVVEGRMVVVDIYEIRPMASWMGNPWQLKSNTDVHLRVAGKREVKAKAQKGVNKTWTMTPVESVAILSGGQSIEMAVVERYYRGLAPAETPTLKERFNGWVVPVPA